MADVQGPSEPTDKDVNDGKKKVHRKGRRCRSVVTVDTTKGYNSAILEALRPCLGKLGFREVWYVIIYVIGVSLNCISEKWLILSYLCLHLKLKSLWFEAYKCINFDHYNYCISYKSIGIILSVVYPYISQPLCLTLSVCHPSISLAPYWFYQTLICVFWDWIPLVCFS